MVLVQNGEAHAKVAVEARALTKIQSPSYDRRGLHRCGSSSGAVCQGNPTSGTVIQGSNTSHCSSGTSDQDNDTYDNGRQWLAWQPHARQRHRRQRHRRQ